MMTERGRCRCYLWKVSRCWYVWLYKCWGISEIVKDDIPRLNMKWGGASRKAMFSGKLRISKAFH